MSVWENKRFGCASGVSWRNLALQRHLQYWNYDGLGLYDAWNLRYPRAASWLTFVVRSSDQYTTRFSRSLVQPRLPILPFCNSTRRLCIRLECRFYLLSTSGTRFVFAWVRGRVYRHHGLLLRIQQVKQPTKKRDKGSKTGQSSRME